MAIKSTSVAPASSRAALYLRVSTGRQAEHDLSIPDQRRHATSYCASNGMQVIGEFVESGASATDDRRPEFQKMMDAASLRPPDFDTIVVHSFSRFFRDQFQLEFYFRQLAKNGVRLVSITQELGDDPMSVMMRQIMALFDEYQSKENAKHTLRAMRENARQGYWNGSRPPFGYRIIEAEQRGSRTKKKIEPDPLQADNVRLMFRLVLVGDGDSGPMGMKQIADHLNAIGIRTQTGGRWGVGAVHQILTRTTYIGCHRFNEYSWRTKTVKPADEVVEVEVPRIIDPEEFEAVQATMRSRSPQLKAARFVSAGTLLGGVCFCSDCGGAMTLRTSGRGEQYRYYTCCTAARHGKTGCRGRTIPMAELDHAVEDFIARRLLEPSHVRALLAGLLERREANKQRQHQRIAGLRRQASDADAKLTRLYSAIENGLADLSDSNLKGRMAELVTIRDKAREDANRAESREGNEAIRLTDETLQLFTTTAQERLRAEDGKLLRHNIQILIQRVEVGTDRIEIRGSKQKLLQTLVALGGASGVETGGREFRTSVPNWLPGLDSNQRPFD